MIRVTFSGDRVSWPRQCVCCGEHADTQINFHTHKTVRNQVQTKNYDVPYCNACIQHAEAFPEFGTAYMVLTVITCGLFLPVYLYFVMSAREQMKSTCCRPKLDAFVYEGWHNRSNTFLFANTTVAFEFMLANRGRLLNVPYEVEDALNQYERSKHEMHVQTTAINPPTLQTRSTQSPHHTAPHLDEAILSNALRKIESAKGPASRRNARDAGLSRLQNPENEKRLWLEYCQIATEATLQKVDTLKTPKAKIRNLQAMLEELQNNPVPNELKARHIALLQNELSNLM